MTAPTTTPEITRYRDAVRAALADLSAEDRDDLMEDVESHLIEVAAEDGGSLDRLGPPAGYAAELRTSAGLPAFGAAPRASMSVQLDTLLANSPLGRGVERLTSSQGWRSFCAFLPELRPGWWVLRGYLVAWVAAGIVFGDAVLGLLPRIANSALLGLILTGLAVWLSVKVGRRSQARPPRDARRAWGIVFTVALIIATFALLVSSDNAARGRGWDNGYDQQVGLVGVSNVYVFDSEGRPLTGVQLFDQDGRPLTVPDEPAFDANGEPLEVRRIVAADGREVFNVFPRQFGTGVQPGTPFIAPRLQPSTDPSASPSPGASPSASPSGPAPGPTPTPSPR